MSIIEQQTPVAKPPERKSVLRDMAERYGMETEAFESVVRATAMSGVTATKEQFAAFLLVAKQYNLNPLTREIYAYPGKGGGVQPIVGVDGWLNLANSHPAFDGLECEESFREGRLVSVTATVYRKDRRHPTRVTEYLDECRGSTEPWKRWPTRMLRHKAAIQCIRYAFGFAGIMDEDEHDRMMQVEAMAIKQADPSETRTARLERRVIKLQLPVSHQTLQPQPFDAPELQNLDEDSGGAP